MYMYETELCPSGILVLQHGGAGKVTMTTMLQWHDILLISDESMAYPGKQTPLQLYPCAWWHHSRSLD